jgi:hypothetical protein
VGTNALIRHIEVSIISGDRMAVSDVHGLRVEGQRDFRIPNYEGACLTNLVPSVLLSLSKRFGNRGVPSEARIDMACSRAQRPQLDPEAPWLPPELGSAERVVVLVLDGLGYRQLQSRIGQLPTIGGMRQAVIDSVAPTTTAAALTSITTGVAPSVHGIVGYRIRIGPSEVLNTLKWATSKEGVERVPDPKSLQHVEPFLGTRPLVVTKSIYDNTGFTKAHLRGVRSAYWRTLSGLVSRVREALREGERFVYLYYEGIDTTAHEYGLGVQFDTELRFVDFLLGELINALPKHSMLLVTADHGQVQVDDPPVHLEREILSNVHFQSGEGRFRWLHVRGGEVEAVRSACEERYGDLAVILTREQVQDCKLFGGPLSSDVSKRLGDVALVSTAPVAFFDPTDTGPFELVCRHGALTDDEIQVPLLSLLS